MSSTVKVLVGRKPADVGQDFVKAWKRAETSTPQEAERVLSFESWESLASLMTGERYRLLRHLHAHPEASVSALARALGRQYRRVHADVAALEEADLIERVDGEVRAAADRIEAAISL